MCLAYILEIWKKTLYTVGLTTVFFQPTSCFINLCYTSIQDSAGIDLPPVLPLLMRKKRF